MVVANTLNNGFSNWRQWYLPQLIDDTKINDYTYGISPDCSSTCQYNSEMELNSAYYMTGNFFLCAWVTKGDCDMDAETYQCYQCARKGGRSTAVLPGTFIYISMHFSKISQKKLLNLQ